MIFTILSMVKTGYTWDIMRLYFLVGGFSPPLWKYESVGMMTFPIHGNKKKMFQATNQILSMVKTGYKWDYTFHKWGFVSTYNWYNSGHNCGFFWWGFLQPIWWWVSRWESRITGCRMWVSWVFPEEMVGYHIPFLRTMVPVYLPTKLGDFGQGQM